MNSSETLHLSIPVLFYKFVVLTQSERTIIGLTIVKQKVLHLLHLRFLLHNVKGNKSGVERREKTSRCTSYNTVETPKVPT